MQKIRDVGGIPSVTLIKPASSTATNFACLDRHENYGETFLINLFNLSHLTWNV